MPKPILEAKLNVDTKSRQGQQQKEKLLANFTLTYIKNI